MNDQLHDITGSLLPLKAELFLTVAFLLMLVLGLFKDRTTTLRLFAVVIFVASACLVVSDMWGDTQLFLLGTLRKDPFSSYLKILLNVGGLITCLISYRNPREHASEYFAFLIAVVLGGHLLTMSSNFLIVFLAIEIMSVSSYVLTAFSFDKRSSESSLKYFLFGTVASAVMLYGMSLLYGLTGSIDFASQEFVARLIEAQPAMVLLAALCVLMGFLFKVSSAPMHLWAPDVYEGAPTSVVAFLSVVPKLAAFGALVKFIVSMNLFGQSSYDWQVIAAAISMITIGVGNFAALKQQNPMRMMAYSSIAHSGFLLMAAVAFLPQGVQFMLYYATVYLLMNFLIFLYLGIKPTATFAEFSGEGRHHLAPHIFLLVGLISLTGLPPTAGFTAKLLVFSALWQSYETFGKPILLVLLLFGLLNVVVSLFYYLRIPYYAFLKDGKPTEKHNILSFENLLGGFLVLLLLTLFFQPGLLMGWINKINFVP